MLVRLLFGYKAPNDNRTRYEAVSKQVRKRINAPSVSNRKYVIDALFLSEEKRQSSESKKHSWFFTIIFRTFAAEKHKVLWEDHVKANHFFRKWR